MSDRCRICNEKFDQGIYRDCGGDCRLCMAISGDPDCEKGLRAEIGRLRVELSRRTLDVQKCNDLIEYYRDFAPRVTDGATAPAHYFVEEDGNTWRWGQVLSGRLQRLGVGEPDETSAVKKACEHHDRLVSGKKSDAQTRTWYLHHPESDCLWTETDPRVAEDALSDGLVNELDREQYEDMLQTQADALNNGDKSYERDELI